ncbi:hypothetical protein [Pedobacter rhodius]|uniref:Uncharacterized protein n=1 Tax=Pedobacter rhodius TaxID=3004098 RepID=A0ABT4KT20_9SPHI|nr:hypothetical protein [Pedobacter sp. SJ11]MCZ4221984.1 hypothetical protein [Pedobacter sp. SJ11]
MEKKEEIKALDHFLSRVKQLHGYGDMNSYLLVKELKSMNKISEISENEIIENFASPKTWDSGKKSLEKNITIAIHKILKD